MALLAYYLSVALLVVGVRVALSSDVYDYLKKYGYIAKEESNDVTQITLALKQFQRTMGIKDDGKLSKMTQQLLRTSRCGERDVYPNDIDLDSLREKIQKNGVLRYNIVKWSKRIPKTIQNQTVYHSIQMWAKDLDVKVMWSLQRTDLNIVFKPGPKGRLSSQHDVLTEAKFISDIFTIFFYPKAVKSITTFSQTCKHAVGHAFGHKHTNLYGIMSPILRQDDNRRCEISLTGAFSQTTTGLSYLVKNSMIWRLKRDSSNYRVIYPPMKVSKVFKGIPDTFDDAFTWGNNWQAYVFKGSRYWRLKAGSEEIDDDFPQSISWGWPGVPDDIDAVFTLPETYVTYFFKGDLTYKYDDEAGMVAEGFPKKINEVFNGENFPSSGFDAVFHYYSDDAVYFFKGLYYWKLDKDSKGVSTISGPYPIKYDWKDLCVPDEIEMMV